MNERKTTESKQPHQNAGRTMNNGKRKIVIIISAVVVVIVLAMFSGSLRTSSTAAVAKNLGIFTARRDDLTVTVTESGSIKARNSTDIKCEVEGQTTIISIVPEGTIISAEDVKNERVLVELDSSGLEEQVAQREIDFASADASYVEAKEANNIQVKQNESDITAAQLEVKFSLMDFKKYLGETVSQQVVESIGDSPDSIIDIDIVSLLEQPTLGGEASQELKRLDDDITLADSRFKRAVNTLDGTQKLYEANYVAKSELEADELDVESFKIQKERAVISLDLFKLYEFPKQTELLLSNHNEAKRELDRTYARARSTLAQAHATLKGAEARYQLRKNRLEKLYKQIEACTITAPAPGMVVYATSGDHYRRREGPIEEGSSVRERQKIITLPDMSDMIVEISVHESSIDKVRPGQSATIVMEAFPDDTFNGEVIKVSPLPDAQRGWLSPDLKVYTTQVSIKGTHESLKQLMSAKVTILVEELKDVLIVPVQVVANRQGKKLCYLATSKGPEPREVRPGAFNDIFVQIIEGLKAGEKVMLNPPRLTEEESKEEPTRGGGPPQDKTGQEIARRPQQEDRGVRRPPQQGQGREGRDRRRPSQQGQGDRRKRPSNAQAP